MKNLIRIAFFSTGLLAGAVWAGENVIVNGDFEADSGGWSGYMVVMEDEKPVVQKKDAFLAWEDKDGANRSKGSLRVNIEFDSSVAPGSFNTGAMAGLQKEFPDHSTLKVAFSAKSVSGAKLLSVTRMWGGGEWTVVELKPDWEHYEIEVPVQVTGQHIVFCTIGNKNAPTIAAVGEFLLDEVRVEITPTKAGK